MKRFREKDAVILFFMLYLGLAIILELKRIGNLVLFSRKNDQEGWMESEVYLEPSQTPTMDFVFEEIVNVF